MLVVDHHQLVASPRSFGVCQPLSFLLPCVKKILLKIEIIAVFGSEKRKEIVFCLVANFRVHEEEQNKL